MTPTLRAAVLVGVAAAVAICVGVGAGIAAIAFVLMVVAIDAILARKAPEIDRQMPAILSRGIPETLSVRSRTPAELRQPAPADIEIAEDHGRSTIDTSIVARRRGRHVIPPVAARRLGPLSLGAWTHHGVGDVQDISVYPDLVTARRIALAVRRGLFRDAGRLQRGPLGLGTDFESIRDYVPDDDVRQVNWLATARMGRPMSNQLRIEQDRDVICVIDAGRLMGAPLRVETRPDDELTRLDAAVDAVAAVAFSADVVGDRCGHIAFDTEIRSRLRPRRGGGEAVVRTIYDLEPRSVDSDYELAFRSIGALKRALVFVFTDLLDESAARPLVDAITVLAKRHHVVVAGARDPDLDDAMHATPSSSGDVYASAVALDVLRARTAAVNRIRAVGADVIEAPSHQLSSACVAAYLRAKALARL